MFIMINNIPFKCTDLNVSHIMKTSERFYQVLVNIWVGTAKFDDEESKNLSTKMLEELQIKKIIRFDSIESNDSRASYNNFLTSDKTRYKSIYELSPTEYVVNNRGYHIVTHPEGEKLFFYIYDKNNNFVLSKLYDSEEDCRNAYERILTHCNHIVYDLPKEEV